MTYEKVLEHFPTAKKSGKEHTALCPAHDDKRPSLTLSEGDDGRTLLCCQAGCSFQEIVTAAGLRVADTFPDAKPHSEPKRQIAAVYSYVDEEGTELYQKVRYTPKGFVQRHKVNGEWVYSLEGVRRVLYRLPELLAGIRDGRRVYLCEGEKDVDRLVKLGLCATCNCEGAGVGKWRREYTKILRQAREVVILVDADKVGRDHARAIMGELSK